VRLRVDGAAYTREARVERDPRIAASDADLTAQYVLARRIEALRAEVAQSRAKAAESAKRASPERAGAIGSEIVGQAPPANPDDSMGVYSHDVTSFLFLENQLDYLESSVESADAAPTPDMRTGYDGLAAIYKQTLAKFEAMSR
jgi:hypothetical protein